MITQDVLNIAMPACIKYKACYDKKANAWKLKQNDFVYVLQPKADNQGSEIPFKEFRWIGPYIVDKALKLWLPIASQLKISIRCHFTEHSSWLSLQTVTKFQEKIRLEIWEDIPTTHVEVTTCFSDVAVEEQFFFTQTDNEIESKEQTLKWKEHSRQDAKDCVAKEEPSSLKTSVKKFTKVDENTTWHSMNRIKAIARTPVEQNIDLVLKNLKLTFVGQPCDGLLLTTDRNDKHYKAYEDRITPKYG